jgi:hypothetical protein
VYRAVRVCDPAARSDVDSGAVPAETAVKPSDLSLSKNSTQPVEAAGDTVAVSVNSSPTDGVCGVTDSAVWVDSGCTSLACVPPTYQV